MAFNATRSPDWRLAPTVGYPKLYVIMATLLRNTGLILGPPQPMQHPGVRPYCSPPLTYGNTETQRGKLPMR